MILCFLMQCFPQINLQGSAIPFPFPAILVVAVLVHLVAPEGFGSEKGQFS